MSRWFPPVAGEPLRPAGSSPGVQGARCPLCHQPRRPRYRRGVDDPLIEAAVAALSEPGRPLPEIEATVPATPGLYAVSGATDAWHALGLGDPPDARPLYVGKSERSLASRDVRTHFETGKTGSSTLRRSLAALLADRLDLHAQPRNPEIRDHFANYALAPAGDALLTAWMREHLLLAVWASPPNLPPGGLDALETEVLALLLPPLNLDKVRTRWCQHVRASRKLLADEARAWRPD